MEDAQREMRTKDKHGLSHRTKHQSSEPGPVRSTCTTLAYTPPRVVHVSHINIKVAERKAPPTLKVP
eukprot:130795-Chlamydomonas_euryale.AAC.2